MEKQANNLFLSKIKYIYIRQIFACNINLGVWQEYQVTMHKQLFRYRRQSSLGTFDKKLINNSNTNWPVNY